MFLIFPECVKITSVGLKPDTAQLQHWSLFVEHINRYKISNDVAGLPVAMDYDCSYDSAFDSSGPLDFE